ncbi:MAG: mechanosensitive ion channel family protein [Actinomycetales bacterium]
MGGLTPLAGAVPSPQPSEDGTPGIDVRNPLTDGPCAQADDTLCSWIYRQIDNREIAQLLDFLIGVPLFILAVVVGALVVRWLARRAIRRGVDRIATQPRRRGRLDLFQAIDPMAAERRVQRAKAIGSLLQASVSVLVWVFAGFLILPELGVQITGLVAGAGIAGLALAFGAQTLISDLVAGIFMIAEDQYGVGDVIDMGEASGVVEAVGLRTTRLRAVDGTVWHVRNGEVTRVGNMSQGWSRALLDIEVSYQEDATYVMEVLTRVGHELRADADFGPKILDEPEMWGVEAFGVNSVIIRMIIKTRPLEQWTVAREFRRRIKHEFDRLGIEIPFPQRAVAVQTDGPGGAEGAEGAEDRTAEPGDRPRYGARDRNEELVPVAPESVFAGPTGVRRRPPAEGLSRGDRADRAGRGADAGSAPPAPGPPRGEAEAATEAVPVTREERLRRDDPLS